MTPWSMPASQNPVCIDNFVNYCEARRALSIVNQLDLLILSHWSYLFVPSANN